MKTLKHHKNLILEDNHSDLIEGEFKSQDIPIRSRILIDDKKIIQLNGITYEFLRLKSGGSKNTFVIKLPGVGEIGKAQLNCYDVNFDGCYLDNIRIDPNYRRRGLASKMYIYIEDLIGQALKPSPIKQSPEIKQYYKNKK